ncbi:chorismate lyase [Sodalis ligni]|uniref:chorismate lyase n=1 Tax=Sodalis ligni TaxID=2697027 RepID=UPI00193F9164|nr:chorismate lyase [Sodalis ligni]
MTNNLYISLLASIQWLTPQSPQPDPTKRDWLLECDSMTRRLERHCRQVSVQRAREGYVFAGEAGDDIALLPASERYWLREVVLYGDGNPWLAGRMIIPAAVLEGPACALKTLGDMPLGRWLFRDGMPTRDYIQLGRAGNLWARRSCLRPHGKPLLLTELFLPDAPLYR